MKQVEKKRLAALTQKAIRQIAKKHTEIKIRADKVGSRFSPTNADQYRELSEIVWWLIAVDAYSDAMRLLDALCEVDDEYYWMFHALASSFATRAWLHSKLKNATASRRDAKSALQWIHRDPNPKRITKTEVSDSIKSFDGWLDRAENDTGTVRALHVLSHAMRVLVMYQQFSKAGDAAARTVAAREFTSRLNSGIKKMRTRIEAL